MNDRRPAHRSEQRGQGPPPAPFAELVGHTRYVILVAVAAVLLVAVVHFVLGAGLAVWSIWSTTQALLQGEVGATELTVEFLEIVSVMLKAVVFYLIGVGFYGLFIAPLNLPTALGIETFSDLELKVVSVVIVILGVTFLEHFVLWRQPTETLQFAAALALVTLPLVLFQLHSHRVRETERQRDPEQTRARHQLFEDDREVSVPPGDAREPRAGDSPPVGPASGPGP